MMRVGDFGLAVISLRRLSTMKIINSAFLLLEIERTFPFCLFFMINLPQFNFVLFNDNAGSTTTIGGREHTSETCGQNIRSNGQESR